MKKQIPFLLFFVIFLSACSSTKIKPNEQFKEYNIYKPDDSLYYLAKDDVKKHYPKTGFYLLTHYYDAFLARKELIRRAKHTLNLQYFIIADDELTAYLLDEIIKAANRGVKVRILVDDLLSKYRDKAVASIAQHPNISIKLFNPTTYRNTLGWIEMGLGIEKYGRRMHNKMLIADHSALIMGGRNLQNIYFGVNKDDIFIDDDILAIGPLAAEASNKFETYWNFEKSVDIHKIYKGKYYSKLELSNIERKKLEKFLESKYFKDLKHMPLYRYFKKEDIPLVYADSHIYYDLPTKILNPAEDESTHLEKNFINAQDKVEKEIYIINPYFIPNRYIMNNIKKLRKRDIEIYILTNSLATNDAIPVYAKYSEYHKDLLKLGVHLYELNPHAVKYIFKHHTYFKNKSPKTFLHAKTMTIDNKYFIIGSANLDPRSRKINTEAVAVIKSKEITKYTKEIFRFFTQPENAYELKLEKRKKDKICIATCIPLTDRYHVVWSGKNDNKKVKYYDNDADAGFFRRVASNILKYIPLGNHI